MINFLQFSCVLASIAAVSSSNYCAMTCKDPFTQELIQHIGCNNKNVFDLKTCQKNPKLVIITDLLKKLLIAGHNEKRNFIAGGGDRNYRPACRMATMKWDDELAELAALNVKQCIMSHDKCHNTLSFSFSGQNLAEAWRKPAGPFNDAIQLKGAIEGWFKEAKDSNQAIIDYYPSNYSGPDIGHFTVMMADRNTHLGCAAATYTKGNKSYFLTACNYATTNMLEESIYKKCNSAATSCTTGKNTLYPNLCSESENYDVNKW